MLILLIYEVGLLLHNETVNISAIVIVVDIGHMLGLDQEREELGRKHVLY